MAFFMDRVLYVTSSGDGFRYRIKDRDGMVEIAYEELVAGGEWKMVGQSMTVNPEAVELLVVAMQTIAKQSIEGA